MEMQIIVDYNKSIKEMIADGNYTGLNRAIEKMRLIGSGKHKLKIILLSFAQPLNIEEALQEISKLNLFPGTIEALLALGALHPTLQREYPIIAPGTIFTVDGRQRVPFLDTIEGRRVLFAGWTGHKQDSNTRFLAIESTIF